MNVPHPATVVSDVGLICAELGDILELDDPLDPADLLDILASSGLTVVKDPGGVSTVAYQMKVSGKTFSGTHVNQGGPK